MMRYLVFSPNRMLGTRIAGLAASILFILLPVTSVCGAQDRAAGAGSASPEELTLRLLDLNSQRQAAAEAENPQLLEELQILAAARQQLLASLVEDNPGEVLRVSLPAHLRASLPAGAQNFVEQETVVGGVLEHLTEMDGTLEQTTGVKSHYGLTTALGKLQLHFARNPPEHLLTGSLVRVHGVQIGSHVALASGSTTNSSGTSSVEVVAAASAPASSGAVSTLVILVNFQNAPTAQPWTPAAAQNMVFTQTSNWDLENSFQQTWLTGDVAGWFTVPVDSTNCATDTIKSDALAAAQAAGYNLSSYAHYIYLMSSNTGCSAWWGLATIGGSDVWVNGQYGIAVHAFAHEMGHNFGLYHAHTNDCGTQVICSNGTYSEYGDGFDVMGTPTYDAPHYNSFHKEQLGWLNNGSHPPITTVTSGGTYQISPYEAQDSNPKALKILQSGSSDSYYYIEFRQALGFDKFLSGYSDIMDGVVFHLASPSNVNSSDLLDMTLTSPSSFNHPALVAGQSYTDSTAGVTIAPIAVSSTGATLQVTMAGASCSRANPTVSISPSESQYVAAGTAVNFTLSVKDNDSSACSSSSFDLGAALPSGWSGAWSTSLLTLSPGGSGSATVTVTAPVGTANGFYTIGVSATNAAAGSYAASGSATYVISTPTTTTTKATVTLSTNELSYAPNQTVTITASVLAGSSAEAGTNVTVTVTSPNGKVTTLTGTTSSNGVASLNYKLNKHAATGTYEVSASASGASATTTFTMQ